MVLVIIVFSFRSLALSLSLSLPLLKICNIFSSFEKYAHTQYQLTFWHTHNTVSDLFQSIAIQRVQHCFLPLASPSPVSQLS